MSSELFSLVVVSPRSLPPWPFPLGPKASEHLGVSAPNRVQQLYYLFPVCCPYLLYDRDTVHGFLLSRAHGGTRERGSVSWTDPAQIPGSWLGASSLRSGFLSREQRVELACGLLNGVAFL